MIFSCLQTYFAGGINPARLIFSYQSELLSDFVKYLFSVWHFILGANHFLEFFRGLSLLLASALRQNWIGATALMVLTWLCPLSGTTGQQVQWWHSAPSGVCIYSSLWLKSGLQDQNLKYIKILGRVPICKWKNPLQTPLFWEQVGIFHRSKEGIPPSSSEWPMGHLPSSQETTESSCWVTVLPFSLKLN